MKNFVIVLVIVFSLPCVAVAELNLEQSESSEVGRTEDIDIVRLQAKTEAEQDARQDVSWLKWGGFGGICGLVGGGICVAVTIEESVGCLVETGCSAVWGQEPDYEISHQSILLGVAGLLISSYPLSHTSNLQPTVPSGRLLGKSPEYVKFYTDAYKKRVQRLRVRYARIGTATGCVLSLYILGPMLETLYPTN